MAEKAKIVDLNHLPEEKHIDLESGHQINIQQTSDQDILEIMEPEGELLMKIKLTPEGPLVSLKGAKLKLSSTESIKLESKNIELNASQQTTINSKGKLSIDSNNKLDIKSEDDIVVVGKMIHLN